ncbi:hypothetical protein HMPREF1140_1345 [Lachnoanaerobaculum sp. ICM7]|uniref:hypothetical protein n=1 Tax=Lachnoanaerobaculum sp. ICM7 TaxID=936594 RepID=UPI00027A4EC6|nr:hypothetical protein [Lachnoanaerobaculum sp. ICM7]EJP23968.1 hypothetical protein HMPREF1140_1345 [Lachnoanaerobaculum sp. ICM7]
MRFEGRILGKAGVNKLQTTYILGHILMDMGYSMRFSFDKYVYSISYMKEENDILFFNDAEHMIEVYSYERNLEIPTERAKELGLETYYRFSNIYGKELIILELLHRYLEENPNDIFYVDNGRYYNKAMIDSIYKGKPDKNWIYKSPYSVGSMDYYINICLTTIGAFTKGMLKTLYSKNITEGVELRYEGRIIGKRLQSKQGIPYRMAQILRKMNRRNTITVKRESYNILYTKFNRDDYFYYDDDKVIEIYCNTQMIDIPTDEIMQMSFETYFRITDLIGKEMQVLEIVHNYLNKFPEDIFYIDNGCFFTKAQIDEIFNNKDKNEKWIFKERERSNFKSVEWQEMYKF